jgi:hypothetical protein
MANFDPTLISSFEWTSSKNAGSARPKAMAEFDYNALAELFPTRRLPRRQSFGYKRFAKAALAIRFAMEDLPRGCLVGAFLEVNERRYGSDDIRRLYESADYPLARRGALWPTRLLTSIDIGGWPLRKPLNSADY